MLDFEVKPGKSLGEFKLGMPLPLAISYIQKNYKNIPAVELKYCEEDLLSACILIDLVEEGILLRFDPRTQTLLMIEVYDLTKVILRYANVAFSGPDINSTFVLIYSRFGPSFPGDFDEKTRIYNLHYPGITFSFHIPDAYDVLDETELPLEFGDGMTPTTTSMTLYNGSRQAPVLAPHPPDYYEEVHVMVSKCIYFTRRRCRLDFYSTAQDVLAELGRPDRIYYKLEDKMKIHAGGKSSDTVCEDYYYNYFSLGLDILFDMQSHVAKKFILHTNYPCHYDFNVYVKCNFRLFFEDSPFFGKLLSATPASSPDVHKRSEVKAAGEKAGAAGRASSSSARGDNNNKSVDEMLHSLARGSDDEDEERGRGRGSDDSETEEESLVSKKRAGKQSNNHHVGGGKKQQQKQQQQQRVGSRKGGESPQNGRWKEQSMLGEALMREGLVREDAVGAGAGAVGLAGTSTDSEEKKGRSKNQKRRGRRKQSSEELGGKEKEEVGHHEEDGAIMQDLSVSPNTTTTPTMTPTTTTTTTTNERVLRVSNEKGKEKVHQQQELPRLIHPDMQWDEIKELLPGGNNTKPVVNSVGTSASPFGSTRFFGHKDVIFEVMRNHHVASVCLFASSLKSATRGGGKDE